MQRSTQFVLAGVIASLGAALARAESLPSKHSLLYEIHETPGDPSSDLIWTVTLRVTPLVRLENLVQWRVTIVEVADVAGGRTWREIIPSSAQKGWWIEHACPEHPVEAEFCDAPMLAGQADPQSGTTDGLDYEFHTEDGAAAAIPHAWWKLTPAGGPVGSKEDDRPVRLTCVEDLS